MSLQADRAWVQQEVGKVTNPQLITALKALLLYREEKLNANNENVLSDDQFIEELGCTVGEYNQELEEANAEVEAGNYVTHDEVKKKFDSWLKK